MRTKFKGCVEAASLGFLGGMALAVGLMIIFIPYPGHSVLKKEAVEIGHAEYYLDEDYQRQWRWLPVLEKENALPEIPPAEAK